MNLYFYSHFLLLDPSFSCFLLFFLMQTIVHCSLKIIDFENPEHVLGILKGLT